MVAHHHRDDVYSRREEVSPSGAGAQDTVGLRRTRVTAQQEEQAERRNRGRRKEAFRGERDP